MTEPLVFAHQAGFEMFHLVGQLRRQTLNGLQPVLLFRSLKTLAVADESIIDAEPQACREADAPAL